MTLNLPGNLPTDPSGWEALNQAIQQSDPTDPVHVLQLTSLLEKLAIAYYQGILGWNFDIQSLEEFLTILQAENS